MRNSAFLVIGLALILVQSNLFRFVGPLHVPGITPSLVLPLVVFMGVHEYVLWRGALLAFGIGYLLDVFSAAPLGLYTFISVALFVIARGAGVRLAAQTLVTKVALAFAFSLLESCIILIVVAIFGSDAARPRALASLVLPHAIATALASPLVFRLAERVHQVTTTQANSEAVER
ncbi:MAG: rod shape-determining protein MreD [Deltaproteobacteria bacterium]|nr:rod shape-determining protein MreD [Deltaproteobacteria bacterium]